MSIKVFEFILLRYFLIHWSTNCEICVDIQPHKPRRHALKSWHDRYKSFFFRTEPPAGVSILLGGYFGFRPFVLIEGAAQNGIFVLFSVGKAG